MIQNRDNVITAGQEWIVNDSKMWVTFMQICITVYSKKRKYGCLSHISCVCLVSAFYNPNLQLQRLGPFVVILWLCNIL